MNTFIEIEFKRGRKDDDIKDSQLLKRIQPTVEKRKEDDKIDLERSTSTTVSYVQEKYTGRELKQEYQSMKGSWDGNRGELPKVIDPKNKKQYADAVCDCRKLIIAHSPEWERNRRDEIETAINERDSQAEAEVRDQLRRMSEENFFHLCLTDEIKSSYSERHIINTTGEPQGSQLSQQGALSQYSHLSSGLHSISSL